MSQDIPLTTPLTAHHSLTSQNIKLTDCSTFKTGVESGVTTFKLVTSIPIYRKDRWTRPGDTALDMTADIMAVIVTLDHTGDRGSRQDQCILFESRLMESGSFRPRSSSPLRRFAPAAFRPRSFRPWSFRPPSRFAPDRFAPRRNINIFC